MLSDLQDWNYFAISSDNMEARKAFADFIDDFRPDTPEFIIKIFKECTSCAEIRNSFSLVKYIFNTILTRYNT